MDRGTGRCCLRDPAKCPRRCLSSGRGWDSSHRAPRSADPRSQDSTGTRIHPAHSVHFPHKFNRSPRVALGDEMGGHTDSIIMCSLCVLVAKKTTESGKSLQAPS